jgi:hypothetical protein
VIGTSGDRVIGKIKLPQGNPDIAVIARHRRHRVIGKSDRVQWYCSHYDSRGAYMTTFTITDGLGFREGEDSLGMVEEERKLWYQSDLYSHQAAVLQMRNERRAREAKERERQAWSRTEAGQLLKQLGECFAAYRDCLTQDPELKERALEHDELNQKIFDRMKTNVDRANSAPRCRYEKANGMRCRAPRVRGKKYCHMHQMLEEARPEKISLPSLGDANGIQAAIAKGAQAVVDGKLEQKQASILGYYLQLALSNVGRVDFEDGWEEVEE